MENSSNFITDLSRLSEENFTDSNSQGFNSNDFSRLYESEKCGLERFFFLVKRGGKIERTNAGEQAKAFGFEKAQAVTKLLAPESNCAWIHAERNSSKNSFQKLQLSFLANDGSIVPTVSLVCTMEPGGRIIVFSIFKKSEIELMQGEAQEDSVSTAIKNYIDENFATPLPSLKQFARRFGTNEHSLNERFKKSYGMAIYQYYTRERLRRAMSLIMESDLPLKNIAAACGYPTYTRFSKVFRKYFGKAAAEFRRLERN
ncbi:AraC family transcriptional regulator [Flavobacterium sp.]|uniref:helix-turn-helix domain-containing protein n=1 Tax=Flavobacterium sp. TaxID=239 RepID=UPI0011FD0AE5|nr:AraC family transcriptional regulator [Flavobacterium sp.]RZJ71721.1 MAG: AraC family transcriptional regulator [Flavobacterium sp.]